MKKTLAVKQSIILDAYGYITLGEEGMSVLKHSSLLDPCISYAENEVFWIQPLVSYLQHFILFITL
jgi:hypothetical protein